MSARSHIWTVQDLADYLQVSKGWVYKRTGKNWPDPIPRCPGIGKPRFNTRSVEFLGWMERLVGTFKTDDVDSTRQPE